MTSAKTALKELLDQRAATDPQFAKAYAKPGKSIDECFNYILIEAHKCGNAVCASDDEVLGTAMHYYDEDDLKVSTPPRLARATVVRANDAPVELSDDEKAAARAAAVEAYKRQCMADEAKKDSERRKAKAEKKKAATAKFEHIQPVLFDFDQQ